MVSSEIMEKIEVLSEHIVLKINLIFFILFYFIFRTRQSVIKMRE